MWLLFVRFSNVAMAGPEKLLGSAVRRNSGRRDSGQAAVSPVASKAPLTVLASNKISAKL